MSRHAVAHWAGGVASLLAALAPKGLCPVCVAAGGSALSSVGLGFLAVDSTIRWVLPVVLLVGVLGQCLAARGHGRWWVPATGALGAVALLLGWNLAMRTVLYLGMVPLVGASVLTFWAKRHPLPQLVQIDKGNEP
jgi:hypothetical protein